MDADQSNLSQSDKRYVCLDLEFANQFHAMEKEIQELKSSQNEGSSSNCETQKALETRVRELESELIAANKLKEAAELEFNDTQQRLQNSQEKHENLSMKVSRLRRDLERLNETNNDLKKRLEIASQQNSVESNLEDEPRTSPNESHNNHESENNHSEVRDLKLEIKQLRIDNLRLKKKLYGGS